MHVRFFFFVVIHPLCSWCWKRVFSLKRYKKVFIYIFPVHIHMAHDSIAHQLERFADCPYSPSAVTSIWVCPRVWKMVPIARSMKYASSDTIRRSMRDGLIARRAVWKYPVYTMVLINQWWVTARFVSFTRRKEDKDKINKQQIICISLSLPVLLAVGWSYRGLQSELHTDESCPLSANTILHNAIQHK